MGDLSPSIRMITVGGVPKPFPKLVAAKSIAIKDLLANSIITFASIRSKGRAVEIDAVDKEFDPKISDLEERHAFEQDSTAKDVLRVKIDAMKRKKLFMKVELRESAAKQVEDETFQFLRDVLFENAVKVTAIAMGQFDSTGTLVPADEKALSREILLEEMGDAVSFILDDIVATKKKLSGIGEKLRELLKV